MDEVVVILKSRIYMTIKDLSIWYGITPQTIRRTVQAMKECGRYNNRFLVLDESGKWLVNSLMVEDYWAHKTELKNKNLAKRLKPYDPKEVRLQRGEGYLNEEGFLCGSNRDGAVRHGA